MNIPDMKQEKSRNKESVEFVYNTPVISNKFNGKKYFIRTYGCQMNVHDSEEISALLENLGFEPVLEYEDADIIVLNTCAIRENAHDKVFGFLGLCKHLKESKPDLKIILCGCMAQEESVVKEIMDRHKYIDLVFGTHNIHELPNYLMNLSDGLNVEVKSNEGNVFEIGETYKRDSKYVAWVNIMYGCDKFCTYCIVPYTRGKERSRKSEDILREVNCLKEKGYKEVTLLGQNVNAYGKDLYDNYNLADLLKDVSDTGIERIRFVTSHPWDFTDSMVDIIASRDNIMPYIHLPLQSGSNKILKLMNRKYTSEEYLKLYNSIRDKVKDSSVTTDIIVGFPGETEEDFEETLKIVNECKFDGAFTFAYSPRENTPAALMKDAIRESVKMDRLHRLNEVVNKYSNLRNQKLLGKTVKCLVIGESEKDKNKVCGYTENMKLVNIEGPKSLIGSIVPVKITDTKSFSLDGEYIKETEE